MQKVRHAILVALGSSIGFATHSVLGADMTDWITNPANQHRYKAIECGSWTLCDVAAQQQRAHLVTIENADEQNWLVGQFEDSTSYWIGLTDRAKEETWTWVTGEPLNYTNWANGEPNGGNAENYVRTMAGIAWYDAGIDHTTTAVIEQEPQTVIYSNDFSKSAGSEWTDATIAESNGEKFLGASANGFGAGTNTLTLNSLPDHTFITVSFDLYIINSWDGNGECCAGAGPDNWQLTADGINLLSTSFANWANGNTQAYPNPLPPYGPSGSLAPRTGAFENGHLGFGTVDWGDATYRISYTFPHTASALTLAFTSMQSSAPKDEGWGLDNVEVSVNSDDVVSDNYQLDVSKPSNGVIKTSDGKINCGNDCTENYASGTVVTLTAKPNDGYQFIGWGGDCSGTGDCTVTMNEDKALSATFKTAKYSLNVSRVGNGAITSTPAGINCSTTSNNCSAKLSGKITLTAKADSGYQFAGWTGACTNKTGNCTVTLSANANVTATFTSTGAADFIITDISLAPTAINAGDFFSATVRIKNQGTVAADGGYVDVWTNQSTAQTCGSEGNTWMTVGWLAAGMSKSIAFNVRAGTAGAKTLRAFVDSWCTSAESKDDNNQFTKTYTVK